MDVVICGSRAHPDLIADAVRAEEQAGRRVVAFPADDGLPAEEAATLWRRHIDAADEVVAVTKPGGFVGAATASEVAYAIAAGKSVRFRHAGTEDAPWT
jgi:nucleoside 2-deoxyribosyltransferase